MTPLASRPATEPMLGISTPLASRPAAEALPGRSTPLPSRPTADPKAVVPLPRKTPEKDAAYVKNMIELIQQIHKANVSLNITINLLNT